MTHTSAYDEVQISLIPNLTRGQLFLPRQIYKLTASKKSPCFQFPQLVSLNYMHLCFCYALATCLSLFSPIQLEVNFYL